MPAVAPKQAGRWMKITTPLPENDLLIEALAGTDALSRLFEYRLDLLSTKKDIAFDKLLGQPVTVSLEIGPGKFVYLNGIVVRFRQGMETYGKESQLYYRYHADVAPKAWLMTQCQRCRVFTNMKPLDVVKQVLTEYGITPDVKCGSATAPRDHCVQYQESDWNFVSRLLEEEGIFYFFRHEQGKHTLVLGNAPDHHADAGAVEFFAGDESIPDRIVLWEKTQEIRPGKFSFRDAYYHKTGDYLDNNYPSLASATVGTVTHTLGLNANKNLEVYEYPSNIAHHADALTKQGQHGDPPGLCRVRMEEQAAPALCGQGKSTCARLVSGHAFTLSKHFNGNGPYVVTRVEHEASMRGVYFSGGGDEGLVYRNCFTCMPKALPYHPPRATPKPRIYGTQVAFVTDGSGDLGTPADKLGRIKVWFPWSRKKEETSCFVRIATFWAGQNWGVQFFPRKDQEVLVAFMHGDPDQPVIVGALYNDKNPPPYPLPAEQTRSGIKTKSGTGYNEFRIEDKGDKEEIYFHAQKDFTRMILNNDTLTVGVDGKAADGSQTIKILNNRKAEITKGNEELVVKQGNRTVEITKGNESLVVKEGNRATEIQKGNESLTVAQGDRTVKVTAGSDSLEAGTKITLKVGGSSIEISASGVKITGPQISVEASGPLALKGAPVKIN